MFNISVNNKLYQFEKKYNIIQVCEILNINIPKFCYHEKLSIAGNCRMCLVEVKGSLKPVASCALPIINNMVVFTNSKLVKKAREGILEFILLNHPLDCPICDQGGECDLQDQSLIYGNDRGRFYEFKKTALDKNCGFLIKTVMTRCIQCTRCIRFSKEIAGFNYLGMINRGSPMEVSTFLVKLIDSEISGNIIDLCPVGALTSNPYSFIARPWELKMYNTIDLNDSLISSIRVDLRNTEILRIIPRFNKNLNDYWISDITRFSFDGFKFNRILYPFLKQETKVIYLSWLNILYFIKNIFINKRINFIVGNFLDIETVVILKKFVTKIANNSVNATINNLNLNNDFRSNYLLNLNLQNINLYNNIIFCGLNLRMESPLLNIKVKVLVDKHLIKVYNIGSSFNYNYINFNLGNNLNELLNLLEGKSYLNNILIKKINKNLIIFGVNFFIRNDLKNLNLNFLKKDNIWINFLNINNTTNSLNEINLSNSLNKYYELSYICTQNSINSQNKDNELIYLINNDSFFFNKINVNQIIYQGHHNLKNIKLINLSMLVLPSLIFLEKNNIFLNFLGIYQKSKFVITAPTHARNDWKIINIIFQFCFSQFLFKTLNEIYSYLKNYFNILINNFTNNYFNLIKLQNKLTKNFRKMNNCVLNSFITNNFLINQILESSKILNIHSKNCRLTNSINFI